jgi:hypothetical protein
MIDDRGMRTVDQSVALSAMPIGRYGDRHVELDGDAPKRAQTNGFEPAALKPRDDTLTDTDRGSEVGLPELTPLPNGTEDAADPSIIHREILPTASRLGLIRRLSRPVAHAFGRS